MHLNVEKDLASYLDILPLGGWSYHPVVGSTNDLALDWAVQGAPDWSLIIADEQRAGRGRGDRRWVTQAGAGLAISLVLRPTPEEQALLPRFTALAALGVVHALAELGLRAKIKWPNDILLGDKKVAGVLVETDWRENQLAALVVGLGVNVKPDAIPQGEQLRYPATSVTEVLGAAVIRWQLLVDIIKAMIVLRNTLTVDEFIDEWNHHLAFRGDLVSIKNDTGKVGYYRLCGIKADGSLSVLDDSGENIEIISGEIGMPG